MILSKVARLLVAALAMAGAKAHPHLSPEEMADYQREITRSTETLGRCLELPGMQRLNARMAAQRSEALQHLRKARGIDTSAYMGPRDKPALEKWNGMSHERYVGPGVSKDPQDLFHFKWSDKPVAKPAGCILTPESIYGPYWQEEQPQRQDIRDGRKGVYLRLALQVIDLDTCKPLRGARVDAWHTNAEGAYSSKADSWLRGWQPTSEWGTVSFDTIFPGHYSGRATHVHVTVRQPNAKSIVHSGQIYFDEWPRRLVETKDPYTKNKNKLVHTVDDAWAPDAASSKYDPFAQWAWLGYPRIDDGVLAWIAMGVNLTAPVKQPPDRKRSFLNDHLEH